MANLRLLSAGAAQAVSERIIEAFQRETGTGVSADFSAVGAIKARVTGGEAVDVIILTRAMIDELVQSHWVVDGTRLDLGTVGTGVAVRTGTRSPDVSNADALRRTILASRRIVCPDPAVATAGKVVMSLMEKLGVAHEVQSRMQFFPNGYAAMKWLAAHGGEGDLGITQDTEILPNEGVAYAGPLPPEFQMKTVYSAGIAEKAAEPRIAHDFLARYTTAAGQAILRDGGYELPR